LADSIAQLREAFDTLDKQEKYREKQVAECLAKARELSKKGDKKGTLSGFQLGFDEFRSNVSAQEEKDVGEAD